MPVTSTENLSLAAFACSEGAALRRITVSRSNGRRTAVFELEAPDIERLSTAYYDETAIVNLAQYRNHLERLKDRLFETLRETTETETRDRRTHDPHRQGRARAPQGAR